MPDREKNQAMQPTVANRADEQARRKVNATAPELRFSFFLPRSVGAAAHVADRISSI